MIDKINEILDKLFNTHLIKVFTPDNNIIMELNTGELLLKIFIYTAVIYLSLLILFIIKELIKL